MECAADRHKGQRRRGGLKTREKERGERKREKDAGDACWRVCWSTRSKVPCEPKGRRNVFIPFPTPPSDQEGLSRHEWFIPSISGDYFIYPEGPLFLLSLSFSPERAHTERTFPITVVALETLARWNHPPIRRSSPDPSAVLPREKKIPRTPDAASHVSCRENGSRLLTLIVLSISVSVDMSHECKVTFFVSNVIGYRKNYYYTK